jgi:DNA-directed RNA polymerase specialized sigma24 family protein
VLADALKRLGCAVRALPERQREALVRHVLDGEPHDVVARHLAVSVAATKSLVNRARVELRHRAVA